MILAFYGLVLSKNGARSAAQRTKRPFVFIRSLFSDRVCSPGGSTIQGVRTLEEGGMRGVVFDAVIAAYEKTLDLKKASE